MTVQPLSEIAAQLDRDSWTPLDLNTLPDTPPIRPVLGETSLVYPGKRHVFSGPPESAKTLAAYAILIQVARTGGIGVLIDFEMGAYDALHRLRELGATPEEISRILYLEPDQPATDERIDALIQLEPDLVVVDAAAGAYQLEGLDDNKRGDVERLSRLYVTAFWRASIATILIDHVVKNAETRGRFVIGSERKLGGADVHLGFETVKAVSRGTDGRYKIVTHKDRGGYLKRGHLADLHFDSDPDTNEISWSFTEPQVETTDAGAFRPTGLMEKVSIHLSLQFEPRTRNEICEAITAKKKFVLDAITALVAEGYATEEAGPNRSRLVRHVTLFREDSGSESGSTMVREPLAASPQRTTNVLFGHSAQPCGSSVVPGSSPVVPGTTSGGGSVVPHYVVGEPAGTSDTAELEPPGGSQGWFDENGDLFHETTDTAIPADEDDLFA